jgi:arylsulfatase A-like enzyme
MQRAYIVLKTAAAYGIALSAVETLTMLAGHGAQMPALSRGAICAVTAAGDVVFCFVLTLSFYGAVCISGKLIPALRRRALALVETAVVSVVLAIGGVLFVRSHFYVGLPSTHPCKLAAFAACVVAAPAVAVAWRALRKKVAKKPVLITAAAAYLAAAAVLFALPDIKWAFHPKAVGPDVVFISLDTVRADHLGCYGAEPSPSPNLDRFADESLLFENAICVQPTTNPSHVSMFTGLYPAQHGVTSNFVPMRRGIPNVAGLLAAYGYETVGLTGGFPLDRRLSNLGAGFRYYDDYINPWSRFRHSLLYRFAMAADAKLYGSLRPAPSVTASALRALRARRSRPLFLFVHYFDPHSPYLYHGSAEKFYKATEPVAFAKQFRELNGRWHKYRRGAPRPEFAAAVEALYNDEISYTDEALGDLLAELRRRDRYAETLVIVTSDHGESFGGHGYKYHGASVYDAQTRVCLAIKPPAETPTAPRVRTQVETLCLAYTVITAAGAPADPFDGKRCDLLVVRDDAAAPAGRGFSQTNDKTTLPDGSRLSRKFCVRTADKKIILDTARNTYEYFDLATDPGEKHNLRGLTDDPAYETYRRELLGHVKAASSTAAGGVTGDLADALKSLGYTN